MKSTILLICIFSVSLFISCDRPDDSLHRPILKIKKEDIISIENNTSLFSIDDVIIINSDVENTQTTIDGQEITLGDYYGEGEPKVLWHRLTLLKESNFGGLIRVSINDEFIVSIEGESTTEGSTSIRIISTLKDEMYKNKFGIKLKEAGTYYLSSSGDVLISGGDYEKGIIHFYTNIINSEESGMYKFTVK